jgi:hypothetical protein
MEQRERLSLGLGKQPRGERSLGLSEMVTKPAKIKAL